MKKDITIREKYSRAAEITDQAEADKYFEELVTHSMQFGKTREEAELIEITNLGYYAGYFSDAVAQRIFKLFNCTHPVFGRATPTIEQLIQAGKELAEKV